MTFTAGPESCRFHTLRIFFHPSLLAFLKILPLPHGLFQTTFATLYFDFMTKVITRTLKTCFIFMSKLRQVDVLYLQHNYAFNNIETWYNKKAALIAQIY
jgi:hypothetical protein